MSDSELAAPTGYAIDDFRRALIAAGLTAEASGIATGICAEYAQSAYQQGHNRGYNQGFAAGRRVPATVEEFAFNELVRHRCGHIRQGYTLDEIVQRLLSNEYSAEMIMQHLLLLVAELLHKETNNKGVSE